MYNTIIHHQVITIHEAKLDDFIDNPKMTVDPVDRLPPPIQTKNGKYNEEAVEEEIRGICAQVLGRPIARVRVKKSFLSQGGDSLLAIKLMAHCREAGYTISIRDILQSASIVELCRRAEHRDASSPSGDSDAGTSDVATSDGASANGVTGSEADMALRTPLTTVQRIHLAARATRVKVFRFFRPTEKRAIHDALRLILNRHPILSAYQTKSAGQDHELDLSEEGQGSPIFETRDLKPDCEASDAELLEAMGNMVDRMPNPAFAAIAFTAGDASVAHQVGLAASRAIMDEISWDILLDDLDFILSGNQSGPPLEKRSSLRASSESKRTADGQSSPIEGKENLMREPEDDIDPRTTELLFDEATHAVLRTEPRDFLMAAMHLAIQTTPNWDSGQLQYRTIVNGRGESNRADSARAIGCFDHSAASIIDNRTGVEGDVDLVRRIRDTRMGHFGTPDQRLDSSATGTQPYAVLDISGLHHVQDPTRKTLEDVCRGDVRRDSTTKSPLDSPRLSVEPFWAGGCLKFYFDSENRSSRQELATAFRFALTGLLNRFQSYELHGTLGDFTNLDITYAEIDTLVSTDLKRVTPDPLANVETVFPCSATQEVFIIAQGVNREMYQCAGVAEIRSSDSACPLDYNRLRDAWRQVVRDHAALRTVFIDSVNRPGHYDQVVLKDCISTFEYLEDKEGDSVSSQLSSRRTVGFDTYGPTHQATICRRSESSAILRLDISHALVDGESMNALFQDLSRAYQGESFGAPSAMPYSDFVSYQRGLSPEVSISYWTGYLSGANPSFFPTNGDHLRHEDLRSVRFRASFPTSVIGRFCETANVTTANLCQAAWALVLRSYTGSDDVCFSYASSGRHVPLPGINNTIGVFVDTMICRVKMGSDATLPQVLDKTKSDFLEGMCHPSVFMAGHETHGREFSRLRGNTIMSCQRKMAGELVHRSGLSFELLDAVNPSEVSLMKSFSVVS